jgi:hypothetical protein
VNGHRPFSLAGGNDSKCPTPAVRNIRRNRLSWVECGRSLSKPFYLRTGPFTASLPSRAGRHRARDALVQEKRSTCRSRRRSGRWPSAGTPEICPPLVTDRKTADNRELPQRPHRARYASTARSSPRRHQPPQVRFARLNATQRYLAIRISAYTSSNVCPCRWTHDIV